MSSLQKQEWQHKYMPIQMKLAGEGEDTQASSLRLDMHVHSAFSRDSVVPVGSIVRT